VQDLISALNDEAYTSQFAYKGTGSPKSSKGTRSLKFSDDSSGYQANENINQI
jgi:hypothetical protein